MINKELCFGWQNLLHPDCYWKKKTFTLILIHPKGHIPTGHSVIYKNRRKKRKLIRLQNKIFKIATNN